MIYDKTRYIAPYSYLINKDIQEYDIAKANISILRDSGYLNEDQYKYFYNLPKQEREIKIGLLIRRDPKVNKILSNAEIKIINDSIFNTINNNKNEK